MYLESETISRGANVGASVRAAMIATTSPVWFDCALPGTLIALFRSMLTRLIRGSR